MRAAFRKSPRPLRLWYAPYGLEPLGPLNRKTGRQVRPGFLIKIQTSDFAQGYADCHPWKMFGDESPTRLLQRLREGRFTPLLERSLFFAQLDGLVREEARSLFDKKIKIKSHFTWGAALANLSPSSLKKIKAHKYSTIKLKMAGRVEEQVGALQKLPLELWRKFRWRLDFNGSGGEKLLRRMPKDFLKFVDLIEDPEAYDIKKWKQIERDYSLSVAYDQPYAQSAAQTPLPAQKLYAGRRIIKPARQALLARPGDVITNSMDHPVGQSFAFWQAQESVRQQGSIGECGLQTTHLFKTNPFFKEIFSPTPYFKPSSGTGVGFDDLLNRQTWLPL